MRGAVYSVISLRCEKTIFFSAREFQFQSGDFGCCPSQSIVDRLADTRFQGEFDPQMLVVLLIEPLYELKEVVGYFVEITRF